MTEAMTENMISKDQLKALLAKAKQNLPVEEPDVDAVEYDWTRPHHFSTRHHRRLKEFTDELDIELAEQFMSVYSDEVTVTIPGIEEHFATKLQNIQNNTRGCHYLTFGEEGGAPIGMVILPKRSAVHWAAKILKDAIPENVDEAELSQLEMSLLTDHVKKIISVLSNCFTRHNLPALKSGHELTFEEWPLENITDFEEMSVLEFAVADGEEQTSASFAMLSRSFDSMFDISSEQKNLTAKQIQDLIVGHLNNIPLEMECQLGTASAAVADLMTVEEGDVLVLDQTVDAPVELKIDGSVFYHGKLGQSMNRYAVTITDIVKKPANSIIQTG
ncbi:flagellar motor switch protein FliM [Anaerohalosphaera lusitana]|uniref:Flagellar motor switch protein FliM n=1 Tax=Anaerohalosphaera lusitana TaxID=1936003 RepID=A0A1U9NG74_9BACT|nr:flagellar motor switch protein FliM [Anaerohalosphaera lusitana]AQT66931.1 flagellar motor switch protein FliM [Anaerohalosphaera lusitana]